MSETRYIRVSTVEYAAAAFTFGWALWVITWGAQSISAAAYSELRETFDAFGPAHKTIGLAGIIVGAGYALAIAINGRGMRWTPFVRLSANAFNSWYFTSLAAHFFATQPSSTAVYTYFFLAGVSAYLFLKNLDRANIALRILLGRLKWRV